MQNFKAIWQNWFFVTFSSWPYVARSAIVPRSPRVRRGRREPQRPWWAELWRPWWAELWRPWWAEQRRPCWARSWRPWWAQPLSRSLVSWAVKTLVSWAVKTLLSRAAKTLVSWAMKTLLSWAAEAGRLGTTPPPGAAAPPQGPRQPPRDRYPARPNEPNHWRPANGMPTPPRPSQNCCRRSRRRSWRSRRDDPAGGTCFPGLQMVNPGASLARPRHVRDRYFIVFCF